MKQFGFDRTVAQNYHNYQSLPVLFFFKTRLKQKRQNKYIFIDISRPRTFLSTVHNVPSLFFPNTQ